MLNMLCYYNSYLGEMMNFYLLKNHAGVYYTPFSLYYTPFGTENSQFSLILQFT